MITDKNYKIFTSDLLIHLITLTIKPDYSGRFTSIVLGSYIVFTALVVIRCRGMNEVQMCRMWWRPWPTHLCYLARSHSDSAIFNIIRTGFTIKENCHQIFISIQALYVKNIAWCNFKCPFFNIKWCNFKCVFKSILFYNLPLELVFCKANNYKLCFFYQ